MPQLKPKRGLRLNKSHPFARGLVGFWLFNEGSGVKVFDSSLRGVIGTFSGDPQWAPGKFGSAIDFDGTGDYIDCGSNPVLDFITENFTIVGWVNTTNLATQQMVFNRGTYNINGYYFQLVQSKLELTLGAGPNSVISTANPFASNTWAQVVAIRNGTFGQLYVNGVEVSYDQQDVFGNLVSDAGPAYIGCYSNNSFEWNGQIDHILIYNSALNASEIAFLYRKPFCMFEDSTWNIARISSVVADGFIEIAGTITAASILTDTAALKRSRVIAGGVAAQSSLAGAVKVSKKISGGIAATSSLSGELSLVGEVSRSRGSGFKPIEGAERLRGLRRSAFY